MANNARIEKILVTRRLAVATALVSVLPACSGNPFADSGAERNEMQMVEGPRRAPILNPQGEIGRKLLEKPTVYAQGFVPPEYSAENPKPSVSQAIKAQEMLRADNGAALTTPLERPVIVQEAPSFWDDVITTLGLGPDKPEKKPAPAAAPAENVQYERMALEVEESPLTSQADPQPVRKPLKSNPNYRPQLIGSNLPTPAELPPAIVLESETPKQVQAPLKPPEVVTSSTPTARLLASVSSIDKQIPVASSSTEFNNEPPSTIISEPVAFNSTLAAYDAPAAEDEPKAEPEKQENDSFDFFDWLFGRGDEHDEVANEQAAPPPIAEPLRKPLLSSPPEMMLGDGAQRLQDVPSTPPTLPEAKTQAPVLLREMENEKDVLNTQARALQQEVAEDAPNSLLNTPLEPLPEPVVPSQPIQPIQPIQLTPGPIAPQTRKSMSSGSDIYLPPPSAPDNMEAYLLPNFNYPPHIRQGRISAQARQTEVWYMPVNYIGLE